MGSSCERRRIYQLMVRHFGNTCESRVPNGSLVQNGCGKFEDINDAALTSLAEMGITDLWLCGVLEQASGTGYPDRPADDPDIVKGRAGSPYAIRDYFDVSSDYAVDPERRLAECTALLDRCKSHGLKVLIDLVPNHVSRGYASDVLPELSFGVDDNRAAFFSRDNNFFYLGPEHPGEGPPLRLPGSGHGCDGLYGPETEFGRVTGNNVCSWAPSLHDWYETVKLNYGHDFTTGRDTSHLPGPGADCGEVPDTWRKMDAVVSFWQEMGVDGFRVDMAHMVPMEFWSWILPRARQRDEESFFMAEAYDGDPAKLTDRNVLDVLLECGFDAVYDGGSYELIKQIYDGPKWANDLDQVVPRGPRASGLVHYAENHDEVRLAHPRCWGGLGMRVGRPVSAILVGMARGPVMIYNGQEVGESSADAEGFGGDDGRTSLFDYWSLPELTKWVNGHRYDGGRLSPEQRELREWYGRLLCLAEEPAFARGEFIALNERNIDNPSYGRIGDETASGHWLYAFLRIEEKGPQVFLVVANLHGNETMQDVRIQLPNELLEKIGRAEAKVLLEDRLGSGWTAEVPAAQIQRQGLALPGLLPCSAMYVEIRLA